MRHHTVTATFPARREEVFTYLADIANLPEWATQFARELKLVDGRHKVVNGLGEFFVEIHADAQSGVIDILAGPYEDALQLFPTRVVPLDGGGSAFTFTMFQAPGQPDEQFEGQYQSLLREFENLESLFGWRSTRPMHDGPTGVVAPELLRTRADLSAPVPRIGYYGAMTNRLSPVTCLLKLIPRAFAFTPSLVPGGAWPPGSWIWQLTS
jgi:hypothetical protein